MIRLLIAGRKLSLVAYCIFRRPARMGRMGIDEKRYREREARSALAFQGEVDIHGVSHPMQMRMAMRKQVLQSIDLVYIVVP